MNDLSWMQDSQSGSLEQSQDHQVQRSEAWLKYRQKKLGASDVPTVMGYSEYKTRIELWEEKTGQRAPFAGNWATERGTKAEPEIRKMYELQTGHVLTQPVVEYKEWPTLIASLDGLTQCETKVVEFKYPSKAKFEMALAGKIPEIHAVQMQVQMLCAGVTEGDYVSYNGSEIAIVPITRDDKLCEEIVRECKLFWSCVEGKEEPSEYITRNFEQDIRTMLERYTDLKMQMAKVEQEAEEILLKIKQHMQDKEDLNVGPYFVKWQERKGTIDYKSIPVLDGLDLEQYRKDPIKVLSIKAMEMI